MRAQMRCADSGFSQLKRTPGRMRNPYAGQRRTRLGLCRARARRGEIYRAENGGEGIAARLQGVTCMTRKDTPVLHRVLPLGWLQREVISSPPSPTSYHICCLPRTLVRTFSPVSERFRALAYGCHDGRTRTSLVAILCHVRVVGSGDPKLPGAAGELCRQAGGIRDG